MIKLLIIIGRALEAFLAVMGLCGLIIAFFLPGFADKFTDDLTDSYNEWKNRKYTKVI